MDTQTDEPISTEIAYNQFEPTHGMREWTHPVVDRETQEKLWREVDRAIQTAIKVTTPKPCMECGQPTKGSRGAAGLFWARLCQPCKDEADGAVSGLVYQQGVMARALDSVLLGARF